MTISNRYSLDLETACAAPDCVEGSCNHALVPHLAKITIIGIWNPQESAIFRTPSELGAFLKARPDYTLSGHNLRFDLKMLHFHGLSLDIDRIYADDSQLMAHVCLDKVPQEYLSWYADERGKRNKLLTKGHGHRPGTPLGLKVLAPYFLGAEPFWENPEDHNDPTYVLKDCEHSFRLVEHFEARLAKEGTKEFYKEKQLKWAQRLLKSEIEGITLDITAMETARQESSQSAVYLKLELDRQWAAAYQARFNQIVVELKAKYAQMSAMAELKNPSRAFAVKERYSQLANVAIAKINPEMNLDSPAQLTWLLRDYFGLDIRDFDEEETTGKSVINRLINEGRADLKVFSDYRMHSKRLSSFFPAYLELQRNEKLHTSFNPTGTRTGRISSSAPNLQQVPPILRNLFTAEPGYDLAVFDQSAVEPRLIAYYTEDRVLYDLFATGDDFHGFNTAIFFSLTCKNKDVKELYPVERKMAKEVVLALFYGAGAKRIQEVSAKYGFSWTFEECKRKYYSFKREYKRVFEFKAELDEFVINTPVKNYFGRKHWFLDRQDIYMKNFNTLIQGTASDLVLDAGLRIGEEFQTEGIDGMPLLWVHDEIVTKVPTGNDKAVEIIKNCMTQKYPLPTQWGPVKLEVEGKVSKYWQK